MDPSSELRSPPARLRSDSEARWCLHDPRRCVSLPARHVANRWPRSNTIAEGEKQRDGLLQHRLLYVALLSDYTGMGAPVPTPGELEKAFAHAHEMQADLARRNRAVGRRIQALAWGLAALMAPGEFFHRIGVGLHAFDADGTTCLAA